MNEIIWNKYINSKTIELTCAKEIFLYSSDQKILSSFSQNVIERTDELRFMPPELFNYYFHYFIEYLTLAKHDEFFKSEIADCFISLLNQKLDELAFNNCELIEKSINAIDFLNLNLDSYNEDPEIYGDLSEKLAPTKSKLLDYKI